MPKLPMGRMMGYASGALGYSLLDRLMVAAVIYFYLPPAEESLPQLVPKVVFGYIFIFGRVIDSIADPLVSYWTDNSKSPRGRRVPFMFFGGLPLAACLVALFFPPVAGMSNWNAVTLALLLGSYFFFFTYYVCPYLALIPELGTTHKERINITSMQGIFMLFGVIAASVACMPLASALGFKAMALILGAASLVFLYLPVVSVNEKVYCASNPSSLDLFSSLKATFKNKPFVIYLIGNLTFWFGFNIISSGVSYYVTSLLGRPVADTAVFMGIALGVALVFIPVINFFSRFATKRNIMIILLLIFALDLPFIYLMNSKALPIDNMTFAYIVMFFAGIPLAGLFVIPNAIIADLTDYDEMNTGQRREAMYFGAQGFCLKVTLGISTYLMTLMFEKFGNSAAEPLGVQLTGPVGGVFALLGMAAFFFFSRDLEKTVADFRNRKTQAG